MNWLKGLLAAALSGAASTAGAMLLDPDHFNSANLKHLGLVAGLGAITGTAGYLKQSPLTTAIAEPTQAIDPKRFTGMGVCLALALCLPLVACQKPDLPTLLTWAQAGIDADCQFGAGGLAADVCTFGGDAIAAAKVAVSKDPAQGRAVVKKILGDAEAKQPALGAYWHWLTDAL
jgi:hypothetical protein